MKKIRDDIKKLTFPSKKEIREEIGFTLLLTTLFSGIVYLGDKIGLYIMKEIFNKK